MKPTFVLAAALTLTSLPAFAGDWGITGGNYQATIDRVVQMPHDQRLRRRAHGMGLDVINLTWEDTGRHSGSSVGPNISDLTLQVRQTINGRTQTNLLPVIRHPNFSDKTGDIAADKIWVRVGNHAKGGELVAVPLTEVLSNLREYLSTPGSLRGSDNLLAERDSHFLVSAQHVFVPIPKRGKAEFNPVLFNYQSSAQNPAVLTLLVTRQGTSATIIDNSGGDQSYQGWGQQLFFNNAGQKTVFTAERKSDVKQRIESGRAQAQDVGALEEGANMMMIVQVPLKHRAARRGYGSMMDEGLAPSAPMASGGAPMKKSRRRSRRMERSDVEEAVLGHGKDLGPFREMAGMKLERDDRFPVRITVQFYQATSNGVVSQQDLVNVRDSINKVYASADYVGSLVVPNGPRHRPTDWHRRLEAVSWR